MACHTGVEGRMVGWALPGLLRGPAGCQYGVRMQTRTGV